jgi:hypothetical protein
MTAGNVVFAVILAVALGVFARSARRLVGREPLRP